MLGILEDNLSTNIDNISYSRFRTHCTALQGEKIELLIAIRTKLEVTPSNWNLGFQPTKFRINR